MSRRGFTLVELIVAMTVMAVLGLGLTRILISDSRFVSRQEAMMAARQAARAAMNTMVAELRLITDGGLIADSAKKIVARIPYAFGVLCKRSVGVSTAALLPTDSLTYYSAQPTGLAYRHRTTGNYVFPTTTSFSVANSTNTAQCKSPSDTARVLGGSPPGKLIDINSPGLSTPPPSPPPFPVFYLYQTVTYSFGVVTAAQDPTLAGRIGLFRTVGSGAADLLVAPFDTASGFRCLTGPNLNRVSCPAGGGPSVVRGLELKLISASEKPPQGSSKPQTFDLTTRIAFVNK